MIYPEERKGFLIKKNPTLQSDFADSKINIKRSGFVLLHLRTMEF